MNNQLRKIYLGIDWGEKRIGLALADGETKIATPFKTVGNVEEVTRVINQEKIDVAVLGKPLSITNYELSASASLRRDGRITNKEFNDFFEELKNKINIPIELVDERLSSKAADALPGDKKTKSNRDEIAAMIILQNYLDRK